MEEKLLNMIELAKTGDEEAFNEVFRQFYGKAYAIAWQITKNDADAKDAVQEAFLSIHASLKDLREPENFSAWMRMIIISKCNKIFRKKHALPFDPASFITTSKKEYRSYMTPHEHNAYVSEQEVLQALIAKLKPRYQIIIEYVYLRQLKIEETAQLLSLSPGTVKTRLHRARKDLLQEIRRFEKENHRKLDFHSHVLPTGIVSVLIYKLSVCKSSLKQVSKLITSNALASTSCAALGIVLVTGGVFAIQENFSSNMNEKVSEGNTSAVENTMVELMDLPSNAFPATSYYDKIIYTNKDAYYICINFAMNEADMKKKSQAELLEIKPLYETLKIENSEYWKRLVNEGWVSLYEQALL